MRDLYPVSEKIFIEWCVSSFGSGEDFSKEGYDASLLLETVLPRPQTSKGYILVPVIREG